MRILPYDEKYFVIKRTELMRLQRNVDEGRAGTAKDILRAININQIDDAVVIRKQDVFAPPALDAYANAIQCVIETLKEVGTQLSLVEPDLTLKAKTLQGIADYFRVQAEDAYDRKRKLPD